jgi:molecular chaperone DnaK (HSP70)
MGRIIVGIDLGTTNSLIAYSDEHGPHIISGPPGQRILPSVVHVDPDTGALTVGQAARDGASRRPDQTIASIKRLMGRSLDELQQEQLPYRLEAHPAPQSPGSAATVDVVVGRHRLAPPQVSAAILAELKRWAEAHLRQPVEQAVITVPAYFDDAQRQATRDAGQIAGLEVLRIINEPTAAALAYNLDVGKDSTLAVYDLGGGTFDVSLLRIEKGVVRVLATCGDTRLGGDDLDRELYGLLARQIRQQHGDAVLQDPSLCQQLRQAAESLKIRLSEYAQAEIELPLGDGRTFQQTVHRAEFERLIDPYVQKTLDCCDIAMRDAQLSANDVHRVVMVGGCTYIPLVRQRVGEFFGCQPYTALNPMEVVALGAATQAAVLAGLRRDTLLLDIIPLSLGIETVGGAVAHLIDKASHVPCIARELFSTFVDGQNSVKIHVVQGQRNLAKDCRSLGHFILGGLPPMPAGIPQIEVTFLVDASGILNVWAREKRSGAAASIQVLPSHGLTRQEVKQMVWDSVIHAPQDIAQHQLIELRNQIAIDTAAVEKSMAAVSDLDPAYRQELMELVEGLRQLSAWNDANALYNAIQYLHKRSARLAELAIARSLRQAVEGS